MGNILSTDITWYLYRRCLSTDEWVAAPLQCWPGNSLEEVLSFFKHEVYTFALSRHKEYSDTKSIYLYQGSTRIAKAHLDQETRQLEVWSVSIREWLASPETLAPQRYPLLEKAFFGKYVKQHAWVNPQTVTFVRKD